MKTVTLRLCLAREPNNITGLCIHSDDRCNLQKAAIGRRKRIAKNMDRMNHVFGWGNPLKVIDSVVGFYAVLVVYVFLLAFQECNRNQAMYVPIKTLSINNKTEILIATTNKPRGKNTTFSLSSH